MAAGMVEVMAETVEVAATMAEMVEVVAETAEMVVAAALGRPRAGGKPILTQPARIIYCISAQIIFRRLKIRTQMYCTTSHCTLCTMCYVQTRELPSKRGRGGYRPRTVDG